MKYFYHFFTFNIKKISLIFTYSIVLFAIYYYNGTTLFEISKIIENLISTFSTNFEEFITTIFFIILLGIPAFSLFVFFYISHRILSFLLFITLLINGIQEFNDNHNLIIFNFFIFFTTILIIPILYILYIFPIKYITKAPHLLSRFIKNIETKYEHIINNDKKINDWWEKEKKHLKNNLYKYSSDNDYSYDVYDNKYDNYLIFFDNLQNILSYENKISNIKEMIFTENSSINLYPAINLIKEYKKINKWITNTEQNFKNEISRYQTEWNEWISYKNTNTPKFIEKYKEMYSLIQNCHKFNNWVKIYQSNSNYTNSEISAYILLEKENEKKQKPLDFDKFLSMERKMKRELEWKEKQKEIEKQQREERIKKEEERKKREEEEKKAKEQEEERQRQLLMRKKEQEEREKMEIRRRLLEKERKRQLEIEVEEELIREGKINAPNPYERKSIPSNIKQFVWKRDNGQCVECGSKENLEFDHIIPVSKGGSNTERNIQLLCQSCNRTKSNKIQ